MSDSKNDIPDFFGNLRSVAPLRRVRVSRRGAVIFALGGTFSHFFALFRQFFRFFSLLGASWAFFDDFLRNFAIFGRFLVDFGRDLGRILDDFRIFFENGDFVKSSVFPRENQ